MSESAPLVIVGSGHAGYTLAREFRKLDEQRPLLIISADDGASYYKPNLSKALAMGKSAAELIQFSAQQMAESLNAEVLCDTEVTAINAQQQRLSAGERQIDYSQLVLATGAQPIRLPLHGNAADAVLSINNHQHYAAFRQRLQANSRVLLIGAGLIGCEFANDLAAQGHAVTAVDLAETPLPQLLPAACGAALQHGLAELGVDWRLGQSVTAVEHDKSALRAVFADGSSGEYDLVLSAVGLRPDLALAESAGLDCDHGIIVDRQLRSSDPNIHALGDCIQIDGRLLPFILPIAHGARALARTLSGAPSDALMPAMPVMVKTPACPVLVCPPPPHADGGWTVSGQAPDLCAEFKGADDQLLGFALLGTQTKRRGEFAKLVPPVIG